MTKSRIVTFLTAIAAGIGLWLLAAPVPGGPKPSPRSPARDYADAVGRFQQTLAAEDSTVRRDCLPRLLTHGRRTERAVVLLHGFTNCPKQFDSLAVLLYLRGYNVYLPRVPRHGLADRMTVALAGLSAEELTSSAEAALDLAHGLGDRVTVAGLSSTGVSTAWLAEHRDDLDEAIVIAPALAPRGVSLGWARRLTTLLLAAPNVFTWWDSNLKEKLEGPRQCYPRFASRGLGQVYRLGFSVLEGAAKRRPAARRVAILTTASDEGVDNGAAHELARRWRARGADVRTYEFPESLGVHHDMIDPGQPYERIGISYPRILRLIDE
jgi:pimeloyl-ACP methyl ester carboxylesterase